MKKYFPILLFILICACKGQKMAQSTAQEEKKPDIPEDIVISPDVGPAVRDIQIQWFEKGKALYKVHCGDCHGIFTKGKDSVPNFTKTQIDNYNANTLVNPEQHAAVRKMSTEQFNYIMTFLRLRKIN
jgi:mono/diheme cytochrome c family protein